MAAAVKPPKGLTTSRQAFRTSRSHLQQWHRRSFQTSMTHTPPPRTPDFAFAFDIDGVLVRSSNALPKASETLAYLRQSRIPFILLTNGGGKSEAERVTDLSSKLGAELDTGMLIQSHTPFADMKHLHDKTVLVVGGDEDRCQCVAQGYGFKNVVTPGDIVCAYPEIWPFSSVFLPYYRQFAKPLPRPINPSSPGESLKIDAIFVYNDPRDWGLDSTIILDLLLSRAGILGTLSAKNGNPTLPNRGHQQDGQPHLYYSNPDLFWAASYPLSRLGQGGFQAAFAGLWSAVTKGAELQKTVIGKPHQATYEFAERRLRAHREVLLGRKEVERVGGLRSVYMVGDNPESDIRGANGYVSPFGSQWESILVKTGVYRDGEPSAKPTVILDDVGQAVEWAIRDSVKKQGA